MKNYICESCEDTGYVTVAMGPEDFEKVPCTDCEKGLDILENEPNDISGAGEDKER